MGAPTYWPMFIQAREFLRQRGVQVRRSSWCGGVYCITHGRREETGDMYTVIALAEARGFVYQQPQQEQNHARN